MALRKTKAQDGAITSINLKFSGGMNVSQPPASINDNELTLAMNYVYNSQTGTPEVRPGTLCQTAATCDSTHGILKIYYYEKSSSEAWLVGVCNGNLYYLSGASLDAWTSIGALNDTTTVPSFITYHAKLLIADGGTNIKTWDGTTYSALADGLGATALAVIKGRVVANSTAAGNNDLVTFSGANDETMWDTADETNPAVALRAGFGDNMSVNAFSVFGDDLIVSKKGTADKRIYRINVASATLTSWYVQSVTENNCSVGAHTMVSAFNNIFFVDTNGFKSLKGVTEYGDLQVDLIGSKINTIFTDGPVCREVTYLPYYTAIWFIYSEKIYCYHRIFDDEGKALNAFTVLYFNQGQINSICQAGSTIYLAGNNGYLYTLDLSNTYSTDETSPDVTAVYTSTLTSKRFSFTGGGILRKTELYLDPILSGTAYLYGVTPTSESVLIDTITLRNAGEYLNDATGYLNAATEYLYDMGVTPWYNTTRNRIRTSSVQFKIESNSGRVGVEGLTAEIALVENQ